MTDHRDEHEPYGFTESPVIARLHAEIARLTAERDEARRELCEEWVMRGRTYTLPNGHKFTPSAKDWATISNWDCFRESPLDRLAKMDEENGL